VVSWAKAGGTKRFVRLAPTNVSNQAEGLGT